MTLWNVYISDQSMIENHLEPYKFTRWFDTDAEATRWALAKFRQLTGDPANLELKLEAPNADLSTILARSFANGQTEWVSVGFVEFEEVE